MAASSSTANMTSPAMIQCFKGDVVVWEWLNEYGRWRPYSPEIVVHIEQMGQVASQVPLGAVSQSLGMYIVDMPSMCQIRQGTGTSRPVRRVFYPAKSPPGQQIVWEWSGDAPNEWHTYDMEIALIIEEAYHSGRGMVDLSTSHFRLPYTVHFTTMQQVRIQTGKARKIRRTTLNTPYPDAASAPKVFLRLTSPLPTTLVMNGVGSQPSSSNQLGPSSSGMSGPSASGSMSSKRAHGTAGNDSSESDSDDGTGSRSGQYKYRRLTRSQSAAGSGAGASTSSKGRKSTVPPSATQTASSSQVSVAVSMPSSSLSSLSVPQNSSGQASMPGVMSQTLVPSSTHQQQTQPVLNINPPPSAMYPMPAVSLVKAGAQVPLSLITYAQPLGAHLTRGFPPMAHIPQASGSKTQPFQQVQHMQQHGAGQSSTWPNHIHPSSVPSASQTLGMIVSSQSQSSAVPVTTLSYQNPSLHSQPHPHSQAQSSQGQPSMPVSSSYHGPITRNRLSSLKVQSHTQHIGGGAGLTSMNGLNVPNMMLGGYQPAQGSGVMNMMPSVHQHQQHPHHPQQQQQQHVPSAMSMGSYPFSNQQAFMMPMGMNMMPQHGLPLSGSSGSQHSRIAPTVPGLAHGQSSSQPAESLPPPQKIVLSKMKKTKPKTAEEVLNKYMEKVAPQEDEDCCICCDALTGPSSYGEGRPGQFDVIQLNKCSHMFHRLCLLAMYDSSHNHDSIQCPTCKTIYGEYLGNCPPGEMSFDIIHRSLPGYPGSNTIRVMYHISPGTQGPEHPHPGRRFTARGFPRTGYLPDTERGRKILKMLIVAFKRRLMFTVGQSATTGESDTVIWNEIHHKTEFGSNVSGHGYPDPNYLDNVTAELALKGVTEQDL